MKKEVAFKRFFTGIPEKYLPEINGDRILNGCIFELEKRIDSEDEEIKSKTKDENGKKLSKYYVKKVTRISYNTTKED